MNDDYNNENDYQEDDVTYSNKAPISGNIISDVKNKIKNKSKNVAKNMGKELIKSIGKAFLFVVSHPVLLGIVIAIFIIAIIAYALSDEINTKTTESVDDFFASAENLDGITSQLYKEKKSLLLVKLSDINKMYDNFVKNSTGSAKTAMSTKIGKNNVENKKATASGISGIFPPNGIKIPIYYQLDYPNTSYGSGNRRGNTILMNGCAPTSVAMVVSYLTGKQILPDALVNWCGNSYYSPGNGTICDSFIPAAAKHYDCGDVIATKDSNAVCQALSEGKPVICSQGHGKFTPNQGHVIVLRGITDSGKILVNDPASKERTNQEFDMLKDVHSTALKYWIFEKKK